jgi:hypothetical protein
MNASTSSSTKKKRRLRIIEDSDEDDNEDHGAASSPNHKTTSPVTRKAPKATPPNTSSTSSSSSAPLRLTRPAPGRYKKNAMKPTAAQQQTRKRPYLGFMPTSNYDSSSSSSSSDSTVKQREKTQRQQRSKGRLSNKIILKDDSSSDSDDSSVVVVEEVRNKSPQEENANKTTNHGIDPTLGDSDSDESFWKAPSLSIQTKTKNKSLHPSPPPPPPPPKQQQQPKATNEKLPIKRNPPIQPLKRNPPAQPKKNLVQEEKLSRDAAASDNISSDSDMSSNESSNLRHVARKCAALKIQNAIGAPSPHSVLTSNEDSSQDNSKTKPLSTCQKDQSMPLARAWSCQARNKPDAAAAADDDGDDDDEISAEEEDEPDACSVDTVELTRRWKVATQGTNTLTAHCKVTTKSTPSQIVTTTNTSANQREESATSAESGPRRPLVEENDKNEIAETSPSLQKGRDIASIGEAHCKKDEIALKGDGDEEDSLTRGNDNNQDDADSVDTLELTNRLRSRLGLPVHQQKTTADADQSSPADKNTTSNSYEDEFKGNTNTIHRSIETSWQAQADDDGEFRLPACDSSSSSSSESSAGEGHVGEAPDKNFQKPVNPVAIGLEARSTAGAYSEIPAQRAMNPYASNRSGDAPSQFRARYQRGSDENARQRPLPENHYARKPMAASSRVSQSNPCFDSPGASLNGDPPLSTIVIPASHQHSTNQPAQEMLPKDQSLEELEKVFFEDYEDAEDSDLRSNSERTKRQHHVDYHKSRYGTNYQAGSLRGNGDVCDTPGDSSNPVDLCDDDDDEHNCNSNQIVHEGLRLPPQSPEFNRRSRQFAVTARATYAAEDIEYFSDDNNRELSRPRRVTDVSTNNHVSAAAPPVSISGSLNVTASSDLFDAEASRQVKLAKRSRGLSCHCVA